MSPIQIGCAETPIRTNVIEARSNSDRGRNAERIPIGSAMSIQAIAPPKTSDAVTGAALPTSELTDSRFANERPRSWLITSRFRKRRYWM